jgi:glycosyltransferase involved in cell wall biosynthesis
MDNPTVSVIIPTFNAESFLAETIQSVLDQTYTNFELIIVDDASTDQTEKIVQEFDDPRIQFIQHEKNLGADIARHNGLQNSSGEIITYWDHDDLFHPENIQTHVTYLESHPDIGLTYNARFELNYSANTIRDLWRPPRYMTLANLVLWFPLAPSDAFFRREWALQQDLLEGGRGSEISIFGKLFLSGCQFAFVDRALNYRRFHSGRIVRDISSACQSEINCQEIIFADPRCPVDVLNRRNIAHSNLYVYWGYMAFAQNETAIGQKFISHAVRLKPTLIEEEPCELMTRFLINCIDDENLNHESLLQSVLAQLPLELDWLSDQYNWAAMQGYLLKGTRAIIWNRLDDGRRYFEQAAKLGARVDDYFLNTLTHKLLDYEAEFGIEAKRDVYQALVPYLKKLGSKACIRQLNGSYSINRAFQKYRAGEYTKVPTKIFHAVLNNPKYLVNRGVITIFMHSILGRLKNQLTMGRLRSNRL